jgi:hypothetical protein
VLWSVLPAAAERVYSSAAVCTYYSWITVSQIIFFSYAYYNNSSFYQKCNHFEYPKNIIQVDKEVCIEGIVGSVVECSPATRAARVRFPDDAKYFFSSSIVHISKLTWTKIATFESLFTFQIRRKVFNIIQYPCHPRSY